jgi:hypothetical protein
MHAYWQDLRTLFTEAVVEQANALSTRVAPPPVSERVVELLLPRAPGWWPRAGAGTAPAPRASVPFLSHAFPPPPAALLPVAARSAALTVRQTGARLLVAYEIRRQGQSKVLGGAALRHANDAVDPNPALRSLGAVLANELGDDGPIEMSALQRAYFDLGDPAGVNASGVVAGLVNKSGALVEPTWPDPIAGPNPEAAAQILVVLAANSAALGAVGACVKDALLQMQLHAHYKGLHGVLAAVEPLFLCARTVPEKFFEDHDSNHPGLHAKDFPIHLLTAVANFLLSALEADYAADAHNGATQDAALAAACALSRLTVLHPSLGFEFDVLGSAEATPEPDAHNGRRFRLRLQSFLQRLIDSDETAAVNLKTPLWMWSAVGAGAGTHPVPARADADASAALGAPGVLNANAAESVPVRAHLLRVLAGPVTALSASAEGAALALAKPTRAVFASILLARFDRAFRAAGRPLVPRADLEPLLNALLTAAAVESDASDVVLNVSQTDSVDLPSDDGNMD